jgi:hypothetical protein
VIDLDTLRDRLRAALPQLAFEMVDLEHSETHARHRALSIEMATRQKDHVYRMTITVMDGDVHFFAHVHGVSKDLTTREALHFKKARADIDEVFAIAHACWTKGVPS